MSDKTSKPQTADLATREKTLRVKYPSIIKGSIQQDHATKKYTVELKCAVHGCKNLHRRATQDLFQCSRCAECVKAGKPARKTSK